DTTWHIAPRSLGSGRPARDGLRLFLSLPAVAEVPPNGLAASCPGRALAPPTRAISAGDRALLRNGGFRWYRAYAPALRVHLSHPRVERAQPLSSPQVTCPISGLLLHLPGSASARRSRPCAACAPPLRGAHPAPGPGCRTPP